MTADPFTEAARAEAERRHPAPEIETGDQLGFTQTEIREVVRRTFANSAEWARTYLAAQEGHRRVRKYADDWDTCTCGYDAWPCRSQEPTDAEVGALQKCLYDRTLTWVPTVEARAALSAARNPQGGTK